MYGGKESSVRCNLRKHMQTEKAPEHLNQFDNTCAANTCNTNKHKNVLQVAETTMRVPNNAYKS